MKLKRSGAVIFLFILLAGLGFFMPESSPDTKFSQNYPATVCPTHQSEASSIALLPKKGVKIREITAGRNDFRKSKQGSIPLLASPLLVIGNPVTSISLETSAKNWTAASICTLGTGTSWFLGASGEVTSRSRLALINSGLSPSSVEVNIWSEKGVGVRRNFTIAASSEKVITLASFAPGSKYIGLKVVTLSGRVTSFLFDSRKRGLKNLGGDFVPSILEPAQSLTIPAVLAVGLKSQVATHYLRLLSPTSSDATVSVELVSSVGIFTPIGFDAIKVSAGIVKEIQLVGDFGKKPFALRIVANQPILASLYTRAKVKTGSDFAWSTPVNPIKDISFNLYGLEPTLTLTGSIINAQIIWMDKEGREKKTEVSEEDIYNWKVPANTRTIRILASTNRGSDSLYGGLTWSNENGIAFLPLTPGSNLESSSKPISDVTVISK